MMTAYSKSKEQHKEHLHALFSKGLALNLEKCMFAEAELNFLSYCIFAAGVALLQDNVYVILDFPTPTDCKAL
jgi:hypothetical protein